MKEGGVAQVQVRQELQEVNIQPLSCTGADKRSLSWCDPAKQRRVCVRGRGGWEGASWKLKPGEKHTQGRGQRTRDQRGSMTVVMTARLEQAQHQQPPPVFTEKCSQSTPPTTTIPTLLHAGSMHAYTRHLCSTPSPWGGGPSNTDVALINWVQHREVGLETTWQFPAASLPPPPSPLLNPSLLLVFGSRKSAGGLLGGVSAVWR